jgi:hypothetical protein
MPQRPVGIANDRSALSIWPFIFLAGVPLSLWLSWSTKQMGSLLLAVLCACASGLFFVQSAHWKRIHIARKRAASDGLEAGIPFASPQPAPNAEALPLPFQLTLQPRWGHLLAGTLLFGAATYVVWSLAVGVTLDPSTDWPQHLIFPVMYSAGFFWWYCQSQRIVVSADELLVQHPLFDWLSNSGRPGERRIAWQEARLFAIRGGALGTPATRYELSSPTTVVTFGWAYPHRWWGLYRPALTWENYAFQMDALLEVIAAKTGLPLYDVRLGPEPDSSRWRFLLRGRVPS